MPSCASHDLDEVRKILRKIWSGYLLIRQLIKIVHAEKIYLRDVHNRTPTQEMKFVFASLRYDYLNDKRFELVDLLNEHFPHFKLIH